MKKIFGVIALAAAFMFAVPAQAQLKFGVKAGLNVSKASLDKGVLSADNRTGFFVGPMAEFTLPIVGLGVDAALLYDNKSVKVGAEGETSSSTLHYIDIPINVKYTIGLGSLASVYGATGPQFSYNIGGKSILDGSYALNDSDFSWNIGAGVKLLGHLQVGYNYNIALGKTAEVKDDTAIDIIGKSFKNNTHQISVAYMF
ncbi:MAG: porin family protein [Bacteroidaceae bacterium]|nr:porin family protein [Bacteroidaceae bacterium]